MIKKLYIKEEFDKNKVEKELYQLMYDLNDWSDDECNQKFDVRAYWDTYTPKRFGIVLFDRDNKMKEITDIIVDYNDNDTYTVKINVSYGNVEIHEKKTYLKMDDIYHSIKSIMDEIDIDYNNN